MATLIREVMTRGARTLAPTDSVRDAARLMHELDVGAVPVCDGRRLQGMLTDRDIVLRVVSPGLAPEDTAIDQVMSPEVVWCFEDDEVAAVAARMQQARIRRLPVVDRAQQLVGIVTLGDLASRGEPAWAQEVLADVSEASQPAVPPDE